MSLAPHTLTDAALIQRLRALTARRRAVTADVLAQLAVVDERKLYAESAVPSLHAWCVTELQLSDAAAFKHIRAARAARQDFGALAGPRAVPPAAREHPPPSRPAPPERP